MLPFLSHLPLHFQLSSFSQGWGTYICDSQPWGRKTLNDIHSDIMLGVEHLSLGEVEPIHSQVLPVTQ